MNSCAINTNTARAATCLNPQLRTSTAAFLLMFMTSPMYGGDLHVPGTYTTIQAAIDASNDGDRVVVQDGTYNENLDLKGHSITIKPIDNDATVIIDGQDKGPVIKFRGDEGANCALKKLTLQNGKGTNGGGIEGNFSLATVQKCRILNNEATEEGGGVYAISGPLMECTITENTAENGGGLSNCDGLIQDCNIINNTADETGGGISACTGRISQNIISFNTALTRGGGIVDCTGEILSNVIQGNSVTKTGSEASPNSFGGGLSSCTGRVEFNKILDNSSQGTGGGLDQCSDKIWNNMICGNSARTGGGLYACYGRIENNTIAYNTANFSGGGTSNCSGPVNCIVWANTASTDAQLNVTGDPAYSCVQDWSGSGSGIITIDPRFVDKTKENFHLSPDSLCIDAGQNISDLGLDIDGNARGTVGTTETRGDGSHVDIGADEFIPSVMNLAGAWSTSATATYRGEDIKQTCTIKGFFLVTNTGNVKTTGTVLVRFYLSDDTELDTTTDLLLGKKPVKMKKLKPGATKRAKINQRFKAPFVATGKYLIAKVDADDQLSEQSETDNTDISGPLP